MAFGFLDKILISELCHKGMHHIDHEANAIDECDIKKGVDIAGRKVKFSGKFYGFSD
jgi:hypothetical protein